MHLKFHCLCEIFAKLFELDFFGMVAGANGRFSGGFDISAFPKMQEGGKCLSEEYFY